MFSDTRWLLCAKVGADNFDPYLLFRKIEIKLYWEIPYTHINEVMTEEIDV